MRFVFNVSYSHLKTLCWYFAFAFAFRRYIYRFFCYTLVRFQGKSLDGPVLLFYIPPFLYHFLSFTFHVLFVSSFFASCLFLPQFCTMGINIQLSVWDTARPRSSQKRGEKNASAFSLLLLFRFVVLTGCIALVSSLGRPRPRRRPPVTSTVQALIFVRDTPATPPPVQQGTKSFAKRRGATLLVQVLEGSQFAPFNR